METEYFRKQKEQSLNKLANDPSTWTLDVKYFKQAFDALERVKYEIEDGIVLKLQLLRQKELHQHVVKNCFQNKTYNYLHALKCEEFHYENDFKINALSNFFAEHITKHVAQYEQCWKTPEFQALNTNEDKDFSFLECHRNWLANLRENVTPDLEARVREYLQ